MICNVELPTDHTNTVFAVMHAQRTSGSGAPTLYLLGCWRGPQVLPVDIRPPSWERQRPVL